MINLISVILGTTLFTETVIVIALLKPFQQPCFLRDVWCVFKARYSHPPKIIALLLTFLFLLTLLEVCWESSEHRYILSEVHNTRLVLKFYSTKISLCYTCFFMQAYLLFLIEWLAEFTITVARLLEFEVMCRHAVLTRDDCTQVSHATLVMTNLHEATYNLINTSDTYLKKEKGKSKGTGPVKKSKKK